MPNGQTNYVNMTLIHENFPHEYVYESDVAAGTVFEQGQPIYREGSRGNATVNHIHMEVGIGKFANEGSPGQSQNSQGTYITYPQASIPDVLFVDKSFTTINNDTLSKSFNWRSK
ncbi:hypothetical protein LJB77_03310 [Ruminococcaceae bacterium OttesenSCG-928-N02]|nr:hypothetical protein [Ruminococcaceae bacterium OttesenSCG-928-N02]